MVLEEIKKITDQTNQYHLKWQLTTLFIFFCETAMPVVWLCGGSEYFIKATDLI